MSMLREPRKQAPGESQLVQMHVVYVGSEEVAGLRLELQGCQETACSGCVLWLDQESPSCSYAPTLLITCVAAG